MKTISTSLVIVACSAASMSCASAFSPPAIATPTKTHTSTTSTTTTKLNQYAPTGMQQGLINIADIYTPRDVYTMEQWATQYGLQKAPGIELYSEDGGNDYTLIANQGLSAGSSAIYCPSDIVLNSGNIQDEFGTSLLQAEQAVMQIDAAVGEAQYRLPLLRLMVKILTEYEKGQDSLFFPWLNSLPKQFYNGVSMTKACFSCLPPYAGWLTSNERINYSHFAMALRQGYVPLSQETISNKEVVKWAYNVALTRYHECFLSERTKVIAPMVDMINHSSQPNCEIQVDYEGNVNVVALYDIQAGETLSISLGDPTNPTPIFAQYGFLPNDCSTIFCKAMHLEPQIKELGYDFTELLIQRETGEIAPKVWDIFLYEILQQNDPNAANQFYQAVQNNDEATKEQYNAEYFPYTLQALKDHVYMIQRDCKTLTYQAQTYDVNTHPRVPVIVAHNELVAATFAMTEQLLEQMG